MPAGDEVAVDLSGVTFLSAAGLNVLLDAWRRLGSPDRPLRLIDPSPVVRNVIALAQVQGAFEYVEPPHFALTPPTAAPGLDRPRA